MSTVYDVVREICLGMPETEEVVSHSFPHFRVAGKGFATYSVNHHGDEKVALLLNTSIEHQQMLVDSAPKIFFVPPYSGPQGWVGIELNKGLSWDRVSKLTWEAYIRMAPRSLLKTVQPVHVQQPTQKMTAEDINPLKSKKNQKILQQLRSICLALPEVVEDSQFGNPAFRAGKKSFCNLSGREQRTRLQVWVGPERQLSLTSIDDRFSIPAYVGHNGWIDLDLTNNQNWEEIKKFLLISYQHFALKRMLKALPPDSK